MTTPTVFLPVDLTGNDPANFIAGEYHQITTGVQTVIRPNFGDFYKAGLQLYGVSSETNLTLLRQGVDYELGHLNEQATAQSDGEVYQVLLVKATRFFTTFSVSYHAFGGASSINYTRLYNLYYRAKQGIPTDWANLTNKPQFFNPQAHKNDAKDLYGLEYITAFIDNLNSSMNTSRTSQARFQQLRAQLRDFETQLQQTSAEVPRAARQHIDNAGYAHAYTKAMIGLGNVANYAFTPVTLNGVVQPAYASPQVLRLWSLTSVPTANPPVHVGLTNNPHGTTKAMTGLGKVQNLAFQANNAAGLIAPDAPEVYLSPAAFKASTSAYADSAYSSTTQPVIDATVTEANAKIGQAQSIVASTATIQTSVNALLAPLQVNTINIDRKASQAVAQNKRFNIVHGNSVYSEALIQVMEYEQTKFDVGQNVYADGYFPVPSLIDNLALWISANNPMNELLVDINGKIRITKLVDRSRNARIYAAPANTAPILAPSQDVADQVPGMTEAQVIHFTPGLHWNQQSGKVLTIKPGMTVIALVRPGDEGTHMALLTNPNAPQDTGIYGFTETHQALAVRSGTAWKPLEAPTDSARVQVSGIVAGVIAPDAEAFCWLASTKAINYIPYPRGLNTPASSWPPVSFASSALTQIGNANYGVRNEGELAELIVFDRALTKPEVRAVVEYLKLRYSDMTALSVDYSALNAF